jgi:hypothetical protein
MGILASKRPLSIQNTDLGQEETRLREQLSALRFELARRGDSSTDVAPLWQRYAQINEELKRVLDEMDDGTDAVAAYVTLRCSVPLTLKGVKTCLQDG